MDRQFGKAFAFLKAHALTLCMGIGIGFYRCVHEWPIWFFSLPATHGSELFLSSSGLPIFVDGAKVVGVVLFTALGYAFDVRGKSGRLFLLPTLVTLAACFAAILTAFGLVAQALLLAMAVLFGMGAGMLFCQWIELCGRTTPFNVILALALSYVVRFLLFGVLSDCGAITSALVLMAVVVVSAFLLASCQHKLPAQDSWRRALPNRREALGYVGLLAWVCAFAFAYGLGDGLTHLAHSAFAAGVGKLVPAAFVLAAVAVMGDRFDRTMLYAIGLPLIILGLIGIVFFNTTPELSQMLISAAMASFRLLVFTTICMQAYQTRTSSLFWSACVRILALVAADAAIYLVRFFAVDVGQLVLVTIAVTLAVGMLVYFPLVRSEHYQFQLAQETTDPEDLHDVAQRAGLSKRETTVFRLLVMGKTAAEISEELFISNGTVRAHCSRIYDKFGTHSRKEFDKLFEEYRAVE